MAPVPEPSTFSTILTHILKRIPTSPASPLRARAERPPANPGAGTTPFEQVPNKAVFAIFGLIGVAFVVTGIWFFFWAKNGGFYFHENDWDDYKSTVLRRKGPNGTTLSGATASTDLGGGSIVHGQSEKRSVWGRRKKGMKRYKDFDDETSYMGSGGGSTIGSELSEIKKEKQRAHKAEKEKKKEKKSRFGRRKQRDADEETATVTTEAISLSHAGVEEHIDDDVQNAIRSYRHEKPARVGGLNKPAEGSNWDGSTEASSDLLSHREGTPTNTPQKKIKKERNDNYTGGNTGGIRKVVSTSQGGTSDFWTRNSNNDEADRERERERERIKAEAKRLQDKGRAASQSRSQPQGRRDFSFQHGDDTSTVVSSTLTASTTSTEDRDREARRQARREARANRERERERERSGSPRKKDYEKLSIPGSYYEESELGSNVSGDTGTKSYPCIIPGLSVNKGNAEGGASKAADDYKEERRRKRAAREGGGGGYRRGRRDSLE